MVSSKATIFRNLWISDDLSINCMGIKMTFLIKLLYKDSLI